MNKYALYGPQPEELPSLANKEHLQRTATGWKGVPVIEVLDVMTNDGAGAVPILATTAGHQYLVDVWVIMTGNDTKRAAYHLFGLFKNVAGTLTQIGATQVQAEVEEDASWDATFNTSGENIRVSVNTSSGSVEAGFDIKGSFIEQADPAFT